MAESHAAVGRDPAPAVHTCAAAEIGGEQQTLGKGSPDW